MKRKKISHTLKMLANNPAISKESRDLMKQINNRHFLGKVPGNKQAVIQQVDDADISYLQEAPAITDLVEIEDDDDEIENAMPEEMKKEPDEFEKFRQVSRAIKLQEG